MQTKSDQQLLGEMENAVGELGFDPLNDPFNTFVHTTTGNRYRVARLAFEESTLRIVVVYFKAEAGKTRIVFTRPIDEFLAKFEKVS